MFRYYFLCTLLLFGPALLFYLFTDDPFKYWLIIEVTLAVLLGVYNLDTFKDLRKKTDKDINNSDSPSV